VNCKFGVDRCCRISFFVIQNFPLFLSHLTAFRCHIRYKIIYTLGKCLLFVYLSPNFFANVTLTALWCSKGTRLIIASHQQKVTRLSSGQQILPKSFCKRHCWFKFNQFRQPLWKTLAFLRSYFPRAFPSAGCCIASPHVYIHLHTCRQATQHALKKRESARGQQPPAASALLSLCRCRLHPCCDLAITFSFLPSGGSRLILCIIHNNFTPTSLFSLLPFCELRVHCVSCAGRK
jgi:hypothetical protein